MAKYLVTGGCGFIGSHLVDLLVQEGHTVSVLDDLSNGVHRFFTPQVETYIGSILNEGDLEKAFKKIDGIFHLAALPSVPASIQNWHAFHTINCSGSIRIFEAAHGIPIIYASSAAIYGNNPAIPLSEEAQPSPLSPYAIDKRTVEMHAQLAWHLHKTPTIGFRFFNVYGPRQSPLSSYSGVISKFIAHAKAHHPLGIHGDGKQQRDFVYVGDVAHILMKSMIGLTRGSHIYNLCTGVAISIGQLAALIGKIGQISVEIEYLPPQAGDILVSVGNPSKLLHEKNLKASTPIEEGLTTLLSN